MYSIIFEELNYELYLAEQQLHEHLSVLSIKYNGIISESNIEVIQEDVKDVVMTYINKVITSIQNAWNKFKEMVNDKRYEELKKKYGKYFGSNFILKINDDNFLIPDFGQLSELMKLQPGNNLESIINDLESEDTFTERHFKFVFENGKSIKQVAEEKILKKITDDQKTVTKDNLSEYIKFLDNYKNTANSVSRDISNLNSATRSVNQILSSNTIGEMVDLSKTIALYFHEDENNKDQSTFSSGTPEGQKKESGEKIKEMQKKINIYFKVSTSVLSTKLSILNKVEKICFSIVKNFAILASKESGSSTEDKKETGTSQIPQIEA